MNTALAMRVTLQRAIRYSLIENKTFYLRQGSDEGKDREGFTAIMVLDRKSESVRAKAAVPAKPAIFKPAEAAAR